MNHTLAQIANCDVVASGAPGGVADRAGPLHAAEADCAGEIDYTGLSPMYGGEAVNADDSKLDIDPKKSFAPAHYEQLCAGAGTIRVGDETLEIDGFGLRDKSWGPRHWQAIDWYCCATAAPPPKASSRRRASPRA
jgi:hypothetical protein